MYVVTFPFEVEITADTNVIFTIGDFEYETEAYDIGWTPRVDIVESDGHRFARFELPVTPSVRSANDVVVATFNGGRENTYGAEADNVIEPTIQTYISVVRKKSELVG